MLKSFGCQDVESMNEIERAPSNHLSTVFQCRVRGSRLQSDGDELVTHDGRVRYPVRDGIPCFLAGEPIEDDETRGELAELNRFASQQGWRQACEASLRTRGGRRTDAFRRRAMQAGRKACTTPPSRAGVMTADFPTPGLTFIAHKG